jgi:hypothetical protein
MFSKNQIAMKLSFFLFFFPLWVVAQTNYFVPKAYSSSPDKDIYVLINAEGKVIKTFSDTYTIGVNKGVMCVTNKEIPQKMGFFDNNGNTLLPIAYETSGMPVFSEGFVVVYETDEKTGDATRSIIDSKGKLCARFEGNTLSEFHCGFLCVQPNENSEYYFINTKNERLNKMPFLESSDFSEGVALITQVGKGLHYINTEGMPINSKHYASGSPFKNGMAVVSEFENEYYYINIKGERISEKTYANAEPFVNDYAVVQVNKDKPHNYELLNKKLQTIKKFVLEDCDNAFSIGEGWVVCNNGGGNAMGEIHNVLTTAPAYAFAGAAPTNDLFQDGLAFVEKGFIDAKGNLLIPYEADSVVLIQPFKDGRAIIKRWVDKAKTQVIWALIDKTGKVYYESLPSDNH